jgi:hypothetical protein
MRRVRRRPDDMSTDLLAIYLNDRLAGAVTTAELARRARASNEGSALGEHLSRLCDELDDDRAKLEALMDHLGIRRDRLKTSGAWLAEKSGRLKLNGRLFGYSPLSRVVELDALRLGIGFQRDMWRALAELAPAGVGGLDLAGLAERAERQLADLEPLRLAAVDEALSESLASRSASTV